MGSWSSASNRILAWGVLCFAGLSNSGSGAPIQGKTGRAVSPVCAVIDLAGAGLRRIHLALADSSIDAREVGEHGIVHWEVGSGDRARARFVIRRIARHEGLPYLDLPQPRLRKQRPSLSRALLLAGTWKPYYGNGADGPPYRAFTLDEDGSCRISGAAGSWNGRWACRDDVLTLDYDNKTPWPRHSYRIEHDRSGLYLKELNYYSPGLRWRKAPRRLAANESISLLFR